MTTDPELLFDQRTYDVPIGECDVVMKGGITSGIVYPHALCELARHYRLRSLGGASAGAIGAAMGAAAEHGRSRGGFTKLAQLPVNLASGGQLARLFQPERSTQPLLRVMLAATGNDRPSKDAGPRPIGRRVVDVLRSLVRGFGLATVPGALLCVLFVGMGTSTPAWGWVFVVVGLVLGSVISLLGTVVAAARCLSHAVPRNMFGICTGRGAKPDQPALTDWLSQQINDLAGISRPLRFGDLWGDDADEPAIDLRMITTCLTFGLPIEMPWEANTFFFSASEWEHLFPKDVMDALLPAGGALAPPGDSREAHEDDEANQHDPPLYRLPRAADLPVIVAMRMSLSFPLLISAVPLWTIDRRASGDQNGSFQFRRVWFTDGGFCSNFPVHLFDAALPTRPTFCVNLGSLPKGEQLAADDGDNVELALRNNSGLLPRWASVPDEGMGALTGFASAAFNAARNWHDSSQLTFPGQRDRVVRVLQSKQEGGLNLYMTEPAITGLARRGRVAAEMIHQQFSTPRFRRTDGQYTRTGWENHRWVRYRAVLAALPVWLEQFSQGLTRLNLDEPPPSYPLRSSNVLASQLTESLTELASAVREASPEDREELTSAPRPSGSLRRVPDL